MEKGDCNKVGTPKTIHVEKEEEKKEGKMKKTKSKRKEEKKERERQGRTVGHPIL